MGWRPTAGTDADAIHDNVAAEISAIAEKGAPVDADMLLIEDSAAGDAKKFIEIGNLPGGGGGAVVPEWVEYLAERQSDETPHADDDFFDADSSGDYTTQTVSGSATWTIGRGLLSVKFDDQTSADAAAYLKVLASVSAPITIETRVRVLPNGLMTGSGTEFAFHGILFTDGTATGSNSVAVQLGGDADGPYAITIREGTLTALNGSTTQVLTTDLFVSQTALLGYLYVRLVWITTTTVAVSWSLDSVIWTDLGVADHTITSFTPTHAGFYVTTWGGDDESYASFDYLRRDDSDLSI